MLSSRSRSSSSSVKIDHWNWLPYKKRDPVKMNILHRSTKHNQNITRIYCSPRSEASEGYVFTSICLSNWTGPPAPLDRTSPRRGQHLPRQDPPPYPWTTPTPPTPQGRKGHWPTQTQLDNTTSPTPHCHHIWKPRSMCGRYASYQNAVLFI